MTASPLYIRVHPDDNVAIVVNDGGLPEGATFADGLTLREGVPQGTRSRWSISRPATRSSATTW